jgi:predicted porin
MNLIRALCAVFTGLLAMASAHAQAPVPQPAQPATAPAASPPVSPQDMVVRVNSEIGLSVSGLFQFYQESFDRGPALDRETGGTPGFDLKATHMFNAYGIDNFYAGLHYSFNDGTVTYHAGDGDAFREPAGQIINQVNLEAGRGYFLSSRLLLLPEFQIDYRNWQRSVPNGVSPQETYSYVAPGLALRATYAATEKLALTGKLGWEYTIAPTDAAAANPGLGIPATSLRLGNRSIWQVNAGADYALSARVHVFGDLDYQHIDFGHSPTSFFGTPYGLGGIAEPNSTTDDLLLKLGLGFSF